MYRQSAVLHQFVVLVFAFDVASTPPHAHTALPDLAFWDRCSQIKQEFKRGFHNIS